MLPQKCNKLIEQIADSVDAGIICFLNPQTLELDEVSPVLLDEIYALEEEDDEEEQKAFYDEYDIRFHTWENYIKTEPLPSHESFKIMEAFAEELNNNFSEKLFYALSKRRPFAHFKDLIDSSQYRQQWFDFKQQWLQNYVMEDLTERLNNLEN